MESYLGGRMTEEQIQELSGIGFKVSEDNARGKVVIESEIIPDIFSLEKLILLLTFEDGINYWDAYRKSPTDPGGYVTALCLDTETVAYMDGNHGWTSSWDIISIQEMAKRIQKNWDKDCDRGLYLNKIIITHNKYVTRERISNNLRKQ